MPHRGGETFLDELVEAGFQRIGGVLRQIAKSQLTAAAVRSSCRHTAVLIASAKDRLSISEGAKPADTSRI